mmetsp:Transcript_21754/g.22070  ORF Transcript_21754/g.22070 Transcript_21754/m.22070 type:complete len:96 (+) Transcript_21754:555-842(+)
MKNKEPLEIENDWEHQFCYDNRKGTICCKGFARTIEKERGEDKRNKKMQEFSINQLLLVSLNTMLLKQRGWNTSSPDISIIHKATWANCCKLSKQ